MTNAEALIVYFRRWRARNIRDYKRAKYWVHRRDARGWVLHYGRLIRKMEAKNELG